MYEQGFQSGNHKAYLLQHRLLALHSIIIIIIIIIIITFQYY